MLRVPVPNGKRLGPVALICLPPDLKAAIPPIKGNTVREPLGTTTSTAFGAPTVQYADSGGSATNTRSTCVRRGRIYNIHIRTDYYTRPHPYVVQIGFTQGALRNPYLAAIYTDINTSSQAYLRQFVVSSGDFHSPHQIQRAPEHQGRRSRECEGKWMA
jgi:hypothetical protein